MRAWCFYSEMEERADILRRRIALYRRYLREGVDAVLVGEYVRQLVEDEAELAAIESAERRS
jgi:hypothetical protein